MSSTTASNNIYGKTVAARCPTGEKVLGGGNVNIGSFNDNIVVSSSYPSADDTWFVFAINLTNSQPWSETAYAICANVG